MSREPRQTHLARSTLIRGIKVVFGATPIDIGITVLVSLILGVGASVTLLLTKAVIDQLTQTMANPTTIAPNISQLEITAIYLSLAVMLTITFLADALNPFQNILLPSIEEKVQGRVKTQLMAKVAGFKDIEIFESPESLNLLKLDERGLSNLTELIYFLVILCSGLSNLIPSLLVAISLA
jgi:ATP-binding cassette subfamily B protein